MDELEKIAIDELNTNSIIPQRKILFKPTISAILPKGNENTEATSTKEVTIQVRIIASEPNSSFIEGSATFIDEVVKATKMAAKQEETRPIVL